MDLRAVLTAAAVAVLPFALAAPPVHAAPPPAVAPAASTPDISVGAANVRGMMKQSLKDAKSVNLKRAFGVPKSWKVTRVAIAEADSSPASPDGATKPTDYTTWKVGVAVVFDSGGDQPVMLSIKYVWDSGTLKRRVFVDQPILEDIWRDETTRKNLTWAMAKAQKYMADNPDTFSQVSPLRSASVRDPLTPRLDREWKWIFGVAADTSVGYLIVNDVTGEVTYLTM